MCFIQGGSTTASPSKGCSGTALLGWGLNHSRELRREGEKGFTYRTLRLWRPWRAWPGMYLSWFPEIRLREKPRRQTGEHKLEKHIHNFHKSPKRSFAFCVGLRFWTELWFIFVLEFLIWGYCWGSMQITIFYSLQCGCYWPTAHPEILTNPGSPDEWVKTELNETDAGSTSAVSESISSCACESVCVCVYNKVYTP